MLCLFNRIFLLIVFTVLINRLQAAEKPNIVLILTDDQGMNMLGCYGDPNVKTPHIDQLAKEGILFTKAYCTTPSCSPSRSVILTGLHNHRNGQYGLANSFFNFKTHISALTLPVLLTQAGYYTLQIGKFHLQPKDIYKFDKSMERYGMNPYHMSIEVGKMLDEKPADKPFFLYLASTEPHHDGGRNAKLPYSPNRFGNKDTPLEGIKNVYYNPDSLKIPFYLPDIPETRAELSQYFQAISRIDEGIGHIIKMLKAKNMYDNTIIIFTSDNGAPFPGGKGNLYDPGVRLPFIVKTLKGGVKNQISTSFISFADITPTILDLAEALPLSYELKKTSNKKDWSVAEYNSTDTVFHGKSFASIIDNPIKSVQNEVFLSHSFA